MKREVIIETLRKVAGTTAQVDACWQAAGLIENGGTVGEDGTLVFASPHVAPVEVDPAAWVPKATADALFQYLCGLMEILDHDAWMNPQGRDVRTHEIFINTKIMVLANIVNNFRAAGLVKDIHPEDGEDMIGAALREYGADSREYFVANSEKYLMEQLDARRAEALASQPPALPPVIAVRDDQRIMSDQQIGQVAQPGEASSNDA